MAVDSIKMAPPTTDIVEFAVWLCWICLSLTPAALKNGVFAIKFPTLELLQQLLLGSLFSFAPGLFQVLKSKTPPTIAYFKTLPLHTTKIWAVYVLILEKPGHRPKTYIGIGTDSRSGVSTRLGQYHRGESLPKFVKRALDDGYTMSHKGLLCWSPIPPAAKRVLLRTLFLAIESAFTLYLWPMVSRTKDYGMPHLCPWKIDTLEYDGCCSHFSLLEGAYDANEDLTPEQINALDAERKLRDSRRDYATRGKERNAISNKKMRENSKSSKKYSCNICNVVFCVGEQLKTHKRTQKHIDNAAGITKAVKNPQAKKRNSANLAAQRYCCNDCNYTASTQQKLNAHFKTKKHLNKVSESSS